MTSACCAITAACFAVECNVCLARNFSDSAKVVVLGNYFVKYDLEGKNPVGKTIMIGWYAFDVIWVLWESKDWQLNYSIILQTFNLLYTKD